MVLLGKYFIGSLKLIALGFRLYRRVWFSYSACNDLFACSGFSMDVSYFVNCDCNSVLIFCVSRDLRFVSQAQDWPVSESVQSVHGGFLSMITSLIIRGFIL